MVRQLAVKYSLNERILCMSCRNG